MRTGKIMYELRAVGVVVATLAAILLAGQPATAAPAQGTATTRSVTSTLKAEGDAGAPTVMADRSCQVTNNWTCVTAPLWVNSGANPHIATLNIPWTAPYPQINSFVIARHLDPAGDPEILRDNKWYGEPCSTSTTDKLSEIAV